MSMPAARVVRGVDPDDATPRPGRRLRIVVLLLLVPLVAIPLAVVVVQIASETQALMARSEESKPGAIDPVVMLEGTALANQLSQELVTTDATVATFVQAVAPAKLTAIGPGTAPCNGDELGKAGLSVPSSATDTTSYR